MMSVSSHMAKWGTWSLGLCYVFASFAFLAFESVPGFSRDIPCFASVAPCRMQMLISTSTAWRAEAIRRDGDCMADQLPSCCVTCDAHWTQGCGGAPFLYLVKSGPAAGMFSWLSSSVELQQTIGFSKSWTNRMAEPNSCTCESKLTLLGSSWSQVFNLVFNRFF